MAGVKVTDLTTLGTADANDIMYIVDTTANQSKQIEVQNLYDGLPQFESGSFTIVQSDENDCVVTPINGLYSRVGDIVTLTINLDVAVDGGIAQGSFNIDPPVPSTFSTVKDVAGVLTLQGQALTDLDQYVISADTTFDKISISITGTSTGTAFANVVCNIQYIIL